MENRICGFYFITDKELCGKPNFEQAKEAVDSGVNLIQLRDKNASTEELYKDAVKIVKNLQKDIIKTPYDPDISDLKTINWNNIYKISVNISNNEISEIKLLYRYSENNINWSNWTQYGITLNASPFEWEFKAKEGSGYYKFKTSIFDEAGNQVDSLEKVIYVTIFPTTLVLVLVILVIMLLMIMVFVFRKIRNK